MIKHLAVLVVVVCISCKAGESVIEEYVTIDVYTYVNESGKRAAAMPEIRSSGNLKKKYSRRFEYLLVNISEIHFPEKAYERNEIFSLYPHKAKIKRLYLEKYVQDKRLVNYFEETIAPINNPNIEINKVYTSLELMDVASKFFYCDLVLPDTSIQAHVCIGLNGIKEAVWEKDYTFLAAFCYEAIFSDFDQEVSEIWDSFVVKKNEACQKFRLHISSLDQYLLNVRLDLFERMKRDDILNKKLLNYYELNKTNLAFKLVY